MSIARRRLPQRRRAAPFEGARRDVLRKGLLLAGPLWVVVLAAVLWKRPSEAPVPVSKEAKP